MQTASRSIDCVRSLDLLTVCLAKRCCMKLHTNSLPVDASSVVAAYCGIKVNLSDAGVVLAGIVCWNQDRIYKAR